MTMDKLKKYLLYGVKWQMGTPVIALVLLIVPISNVWVKTIIANVIGAIIFYPIDKWIFRSKKEEVCQK